MKQRKRKEIKKRSFLKIEIEKNNEKF